MKIVLRNAIMLLCAAVWMQPVKAQLTNWQYTAVVEIAEQQDSSYANAPVLLHVNTAALIANGQMQADGDDIRFSLDCAGNNELPYYIEPGDLSLNDSSEIWVRIPQIIPNSVRRIYFFSGNPSAPSASDISSVFQNTLPVPTGTVTGLPPGYHPFDLVRIDAGGTLNISGNVTIRASKIIVDGDIIGNGAAASIPFGRGGNAPTSGSGAGGGANGGAGGAGEGASAGAGGSTYTSTDPIAQGSSGGNGVDSTGGTGGGALRLIAQVIELPGNVFMNGADGKVDNANQQGTGGGAGGGILINGRFLNISGNIFANGGNGGENAADPSFGAGGGGGGGQIKLFHSNSANVTGANEVFGGTGGGAAENGDTGTVTNSALADIFSISISPMISRDSVTITGDSTVCVNTTATYAASLRTGDTYLWRVSAPDSIDGSASSGQVNIKWKAAGNRTLTLIRENFFIGCSDTTTFDVTVSNVFPVADFTADTACAGSPVLFTNSTTIGSGSIASYSWNFGNGNISNTQDPSVTFAAAGNNVVTLQATSDFGCVNIDSQTITVDAFPDANFTATTVCVGETTVFSSVSTGLTYTWDFGDGAVASGEDTVHVYSAPGTYTVTLEVTSANGCVSTQQRPVTVRPAPVANFDFNLACPGEPTSFTNLSNISSGTLSYSWDFGDFIGTSTAANPTYVYSSAGPHNVRLIATSGQGCSDTIIKQLTVPFEPIAAFSADTACVGTATVFTNNSNIISGQLFFTWNFGDGSSSSNLNNPTHVFADTGTYSVTLIATSDVGCADTTTVDVRVSPAPVASFTVGNVCHGDSAVFLNIPTGTASYLWNFGDGNTSTTQSPRHLYNAPGTYIVTLVSSIGSCSDSISQSVTVWPAPTASFTASNVCEGVQTSFANTSSISVGSLNYSWDFGDGSTSSASNPTHVYADTGSYQVTLIATSNNACRDTFTASVDVLQQPQADFTIQPACDNDSIRITDRSRNFDSGAFYQVDLLNDGTYEPGNFSAGQMAAFSVNNVGNFQARIRFTNNNGCRDSVVVPFTVHASPIASFEKNDTCVGNTIRFSNTTSSSDPNIVGSLAYQWNFGDGTTSTDINPTHVYDSVNIFTVTLTATSLFGCTSDTSMNVEVYPRPVLDIVAGSSFCVDRNVVFTDTASPKILYGSVDEYRWQFGNGVSRTTPNDSIHNIYNTLGSFNVNVTAVSNQGCTSDTSLFITVRPNPTANFTGLNVCEGEAISFTNLSTIPSGNADYAWNFGDGSSSADEDPVYTYLQPGQYTVTLSATGISSGCSDIQTRTVQVYPRPDVAFTTSQGGACIGSTTQFTNTTTIATGSVVQYNWSFGDGGASVDRDPTHVYNAQGTYAVRLIATSDRGCVDSTVSAVIVGNLPDVTIIGAPLQFCENTTIDLLAQPLPVTQQKFYFFEWSNGDVTQTITVNTTGTYSVTIEDSSGCRGSASINVTSLPLPDIQADADRQSIRRGETVQLAASSSFSNVTFEWSADPEDVSLNINAQNPLVTPLENTTYSVTVTDQNLCESKASISILVDTTFLVGPTNVITPNGDGFNDFWIIDNILSFPQSEVLVFDRWGTLVFSMTGYDNTWNGTFEGKELPQGAYYYVINLGDPNSVRRGSISIIR